MATAKKDKPGALEYFSDAVGTIYGDTIGEASLKCVEALEAAGYGPVQARATTASSLRFVGVATHAEED